MSSSEEPSSSEPSSSEEPITTHLNTNQKIALIAMGLLFIMAFIYIVWGRKGKYIQGRKRKGRKGRKRNN